MKSRPPGRPSREHAAGKARWARCRIASMTRAMGPGRAHRASLGRKPTNSACCRRFRRAATQGEGEATGQHRKRRAQPVSHSRGEGAGGKPHAAGRADSIDRFHWVQSWLDSLEGPSSAAGGSSEADRRSSRVLVRRLWAGPLAGQPSTGAEPSCPPSIFRHRSSALLWMGGAGDGAAAILRRAEEEETRSGLAPPGPMWGLEGF